MALWKQHSDRGLNSLLSQILILTIMPVYVVNSYNIHDFEMFKNYPPQVRPLFAKYGAKVIAMDTNAKALEGVPKTMNAVIEFPSEDAVNQFYNDAAYQSIIHFRLNSTSDSTIVILKQFEAK